MNLCRVDMKSWSAAANAIVVFAFNGCKIIGDYGMVLPGNR